MNSVSLPNRTEKRIRILSEAELQALYARPSFTQSEREYFFELKPQEQNLLDLPISIDSQVHAIVQLGYFNCKHRFFQFDLDEVPDDTEYVRQRYFPQNCLIKPVLSRETKRQNQQRILELTGYKLYTKKEYEAILLDRAKELCRISIDPIFIFNEILSLLAQKKITLPGYTTLQEKIISKTIKEEQNRIKEILDMNLSKREGKIIKQLLKEDEKFYAITALKREPKNFKLTAIRQESNQFIRYQPIHVIAKRVLPLLNISNKAIIYYASLVEHYTVRGLSRLEKNQRYLWLLCFIQERYQRMLYNLTTMFIYCLEQYKEAVEQSANEEFISHSRASSVSEQDLKTAKLLRNYTSPDIDTRQSFEKIRQDTYKNILAAEEINRIADSLEDKKKTENFLAKLKWQAIDTLSKKYKLPLRTLIKVIPIGGTQHKSLRKAHQFLKDAFLGGKSLSTIPFNQFPLQFISSKEKEHIYDIESKTIYKERYEFQCYTQLAAHIQDYSLFVQGSLHYADFTSQLLPNWHEQKNDILTKLNRPFLNRPFSEFIEEKARPINSSIKRIHTAIIKGEADFIKVKNHKDGTKSWTIPYTKKETEVNNPIYQKMPRINILKVAQFVGKKTRFTRCFTHIKPHYSKSRQDEIATYLNVFARGTNMTRKDLAGLSGLSLLTLETADNNYIRLETLRDANNVVNDELAKLPIFKEWNLYFDKLHASLDGIKLTTLSETLLSRYSPKYFGLQKGVSAYFLIVNHAAVNTSIHSPNEHESHFVFDMVYNNLSEIQPDIFSTDTEGSNQLNFLLLYLIERIFAPRYRSFSKKTESIVCMGDPDKFKNYLIKPERSVNEKLILKEEDNIKHIMASLLMGDVSQNHLIAKLSATKFKNNTKRALWEMNAVLMTEHLLNCIEDLRLRQAIQAALNRGEAYNQLRRHLERVNGRNIGGKNQTQIAINNECARLLSNCIIYYNAYILNGLLERMKKEGNPKMCELIKRFSPVAWTHIHFQGMLDLSSFDEETPIDIESLVEHLRGMESV